MTENKGDLISRKALKKAIDDYAEKRQDTLLWQADIEELIDNAPTIEEVSVIEFKEPLPLVKAQKIVKALSKRPQGDIKKYKTLELDYNVQCAVENLKTAYWSNEPEKDAKNFTEAEDIIISAICHHNYTVCKELQGEWKHEVIGDKSCVLCNQCFLHFDCESNFCPNCGAQMLGGKEE